MTDLARAPREGPLEAWALAFAEAHIAAALPRRWQHDLAVNARARAVAPILPAEERDTFLATAALHDLGFCAEAIETGFQPIDGARYLESVGLPKRICSLVANSVSARIEGELRGFAAAYEDLPDERTPLRDALWCCCITTAADGTPIDVDERIAAWPSQYPEPLVLEFVERAREPLRAAVARTGERLRSAGLSNN